MATSTDDNLIRLMLQPPKTGDDDPLIKAAKLVQRKFNRKSPSYKANSITLDLEIPTQLAIDLGI